VAAKRRLHSAEVFYETYCVRLCTLGTLIL
jgi:hypothetical protein